MIISHHIGGGFPLPPWNPGSNPSGVSFVQCNHKKKCISAVYMLFFLKRAQEWKYSKKKSLDQNLTTESYTINLPFQRSQILSYVKSTFNADRDYK